VAYMRRNTHQTVDWGVAKGEETEEAMKAKGFAGLPVISAPRGSSDATARRVRKGQCRQGQNSAQLPAERSALPDLRCVEDGYFQVRNVDLRDVVLDATTTSIKPMGTGHS
jgi:hypothetical protein